MTVNCAHCGKRLERKKSQLSRTQHSFCSAQCRRQFYQNGKTVVCHWCGDSFYKSASKITDMNFCSAACRNHWLSKTNIEVRNVPGHSKGHKAPHLTELNRRRNPYGKMCSGNGKSTASGVYRKIAADMLGRELAPNEVVHHINGNRADNRPENLAVLPCSEHHRLHSNLAHRRYECAEAKKGGD